MMYRVNYLFDGESLESPRLCLTHAHCSVTTYAALRFWTRSSSLWVIPVKKMQPLRSSSSFATFASRNYDIACLAQATQTGRISCHIVHQNPATCTYSSRLILDYVTSPFCKSQNQYWNLYLMTPFPSYPYFTEHPAEQRLFFQADQSITSC